LESCRFRHVFESRVSVTVPQASRCVAPLRCGDAYELNIGTGYAVRSEMPGYSAADERRDMNR